MCDPDFELTVEEYRALVKGIFSLLLEHLHKAQKELFKLKLENERREQINQMESMREASK